MLEPFISPALYQKYPGAVDEWTLTQLMAADTASGGLNQLEDHYNTFIVRLGSSTVSDPIQLYHPFANCMDVLHCRRNRILLKWQGPVLTGFDYLFLSGRSRNGTLKRSLTRSVGRMYLQLIDPVHLTDYAVNLVLQRLQSFWRAELCQLHERCDGYR